MSTPHQAEKPPRCSSCGTALVKPKDAAGKDAPYWVCPRDGAVSGCE